MTQDQGLIERLLPGVADAIEARMGPVFGSPEYLADPVKLARAEKRRRETAEGSARLALEATATRIEALLARVRVLEGLLEECAGDLEAEIRAREGTELPRRIARDMDLVHRARAALPQETNHD